jgi:hypothetical protein
MSKQVDRAVLLIPRFSLAPSATITRTKANISWFWAEEWLVERVVRLTTFE